MNVERPASHIWPGEQFRRGHRLFEADYIAVTVDEVTIRANQVLDTGKSGPSVTLTMQPAEIVRVIQKDRP